MSDIYITGHRNPDLDSVCSAMAYSVLKSQVDPDNHYIPVRCGHMSEHLKKQLQVLELEAPPYKRDLYAKVGDVCLTSEETLDADQPIFELLPTYDGDRPSASPVFKNGKFFGLLSLDDLTAWFLKDNTEDTPVYTLQLSNIEKTIRGKLLYKGKEDEFTASLIAGTASFDFFSKVLAERKNPIVVMPYHKEYLDYAVKHNASAVIITACEKKPEIQLNGYAGSIFCTSLDTAETIRRIRMSQAISTIMQPQGTPLQANDFYQDAKHALRNSKLRGLSVYQDDKWIGYVTRRCFMEEPENKVILMDHNEASQSIRGIEKAQIMEIIDHHRLDAVKTDLPILIDSEPLGSTCTIVYQRFIRRGIKPDAKTAKYLLAGIISDTLILKSPTTTSMDIESAEALAKLCKVSNITDFGELMFSVSESLSRQDPEVAIGSDYKVYTEGKVRVGIGQYEIPSLRNYASYAEKIVSALEENRKKNGCDWAMLMVTDVVRGDSILLVSDTKYNKFLPYTRLQNCVYDMRGVMSRKKQLLPEVLHAVQLGGN